MLYGERRSLNVVNCVCLSIVLLFIGCAVVVAPSGGPEDKIPARVISTTPAADSAGVSKNTGITIEFSEGIDGESFKKRLSIYPQVEIKKIKSKGNKLIIDFDGDLPETTICVLLKPGFKDLHGVENKKQYLWYFSTRDSLDPGRISGRVLFKGIPDSTAIVKLFRIKADTVLNFVKETEDRIEFTERDGSFNFKALPVDSARYILLAFKDKNGNLRLDKDKEFYAVYPDTVILTTANNQFFGVELNIIDPNEPGEIEGIVDNRTSIDVKPSVILKPLLPGEKTLYTRIESSGKFKFRRVKPGIYVLTALIDAEPDSMCGTYTQPSDSTIRTEPCFVYPDTISLKPGEKLDIGRIVLEEGASGAEN